MSDEPAVPITPAAEDYETSPGMPKLLWPLVFFAAADVVWLIVQSNGWTTYAGH